MRRPAPVIAYMAAALGAAILAAVGLFAVDRSRFVESALTDFAVGLIEVAITVGIVDRLLKWHAERQHREAVAPRVLEFIEQLRRLDSVRQQYLASASRGDLEVYRRVAEELQESAFGLSILLSVNNSALASPLVRLSHQMRAQAESVRDLMFAARTGSTDYDQRLDQVKTSGFDLYESGCQLTDELATAYPTALRN
jgi:hypothetical protein